ncbi:hypothetical protein WIV_gp008 [Wiseana iridescent virus]|uniref:Uncharacterized protein n=1 Tax=Wiseana iridescent virus TaxID=68347 RepID=G0T534_IRV9|nr:hypothetical protein WIV_gp008 [Wiseana iridescent virus]ADO00351.1 hypothetical protein [Wiseana iridescent virus]
MELITPNSECLSASKELTTMELSAVENPLFQILRIVRQDIFQFLNPKDHLNLSIVFKDTLFLQIIKNTLKEINYCDHLLLTKTFMDEYILLLISKLNYQCAHSTIYYDEMVECFVKREDYNSVIKFILENIEIERIKDETLNQLNRGFWNHISNKCKLSEKFIFKWSHRINMFRFKLNKKYRTMSVGKCFEQWLLPRQFSKKFHSVFPGFKHYRPCYICFDDVDYHHKTFFNHKGFFEADEWVCENCIYYEDYIESDYSDYEPSDRRWSEDDSDYSGEFSDSDSDGSEP